MSNWGRKETIVWPPRYPVWSILAVSVTLLATCFYAWENVHFGEEPLQRFYHYAYIRSAAGGLIKHHGNYRLIYISTEKDHAQLAYSVDVVAGQTPVPMGQPLPIALSPSHASERSFLYVGPVRSYDEAKLHAWLQGAVYDSKSLLSLSSVALWEGVLTLAVLLYFGIRADVKRRKVMKYGRLLKGPVMLTPKEFNRVLHSDGLAITTTEKNQLLCIPQQAEAKHIQIMGDTGVGKSQLITQMLLQIQERGESAIVYDPAGEFIQRFYSERRRDVVLNPLDARCPYWSPSSELRSPAEARTIAASLYQPNSKNKGEFFTETPQKVFARLLLYRPSPRQLAEWMASEDEIDTRVEGTPMKSMIAKGAQQQRAGVLGSLGLVADGLMLLPTEEQTKLTWSANKWSETREGWIFLTGKESEQEALRPLHSLWIDLLILRLLDAPEPGQKRAWFVLDEIATLQRLPQFHAAITKGRKSNNPIIFGYQGKAQIEDTYGQLAEVMLSQPATKFILKTGEPKAALWASDLIGRIEVEKVRETVSSGLRRGVSFTMEKVVEPLVMDSEISGLEDLHAFVKLQNYVSRFSFPHLTLPDIAPAFVSRDGEEGMKWLNHPERTQESDNGTPSDAASGEETAAPFVIGSQPA